MRQLHFNCHNGAAGDMLTAALLGLFDPEDSMVNVLNSIGFGRYNLVYVAENVTDKGVPGLHLSVQIHGQEEDEHIHAHPKLEDIYNIFDRLTLSDWVRNQAKAIYQSIATAEGAVHGETSSQVHFHEVGALDALADVVGFCTLLERLGADTVTATPIAVGWGTLACAHGILPVPAPATAWLLEGLPTWQGVSQGELCTPTGAAILRHFVSEFLDFPAISLEKTSYGMGKKRFPKAVNAVTAMVGTATQNLVELHCNLDDMTGEQIAYTVEILLEQGALDAWTTAITMKKGRPAVTLHCLSQGETAQYLAEIIFRNTTTLGVRSTAHSRQTLPRTQSGCSKIAEGFGVKKEKVEFEQRAKTARETGRPIWLNQD